MKIAYVLGSRAQYRGKVSGTTYTFTPWSNVDERDWPGMSHKQVHTRGCCGRPTRVLRVFATEDEIRDGAENVAPQWR